MVEERRQDSKSRSGSFRDSIRGNWQTRPRKTRTHIRALSPEVRKASGGKMVRRREVKAESGRDTTWASPWKEAERQGQSNRDSHITSLHTCSGQTRYGVRSSGRVQKDSR